MRGMSTPSTQGAPLQAPDAVVCLITTPQPDAHSIASTVIDKKLAACVNIVPLVQSLYWWEGKVEQDEEALLVVKTTRAAISQLDELLRTIHPYETFELIALDVVAGSRPYLEWIDSSVSRTDSSRRATDVTCTRAAKDLGSTT
jgi:periplasmic divalent cation tolerance protein